MNTFISSLHVNNIQPFQNWGYGNLLITFRTRNSTLRIFACNSMAFLIEWGNIRWGIQKLKNGVLEPKPVLKKNGLFCFIDLQTTKHDSRSTNHALTIGSRLLIFSPHTIHDSRITVLMEWAFLFLRLTTYASRFTIYDKKVKVNEICEGKNKWRKSNTPWI